MIIWVVANSATVPGSLRLDKTNEKGKKMMRKRRIKKNNIMLAPIIAQNLGSLKQELVQTELEVTSTCPLTAFDQHLHILIKKILRQISIILYIQYVSTDFNS